MTILALPDEISAERVSGRVSLRTWLAERWAILFSHPQDFVPEQLEMEMDRWMSILSRSFSGHDVATVALARAGNNAGESRLGRLAALGSEFAAVLALDPPLPGLLPELSAGALRGKIARSGPRFAMIIDPTIRCRRVLNYQLPADLPSALELVGWAVALRKRDRDRAEAGRGCEAQQQQQRQQPRYSGWHRSASYAIAQAWRG